MASTQSEFWRGARASVPVVIAAAPFGLLFGALAVENGMTVFEATLASATIFAGASQMVGIELFGADVAPWIIVFSVFAVNFRHILYSATMGRTIGHLSRPQRAFAFFLMTDPQFAVTEQRAEQGHRVSFAWYLGLGLPIYVLWVLEGYLGALFGGLIEDPSVYAIDFLLPLYFLGLVMDFRGRPNWLPVVGVSAVMATLAFHFVGNPWHVSLGAIAGVLVAAAIGGKPAQEAP